MSREIYRRAHRTGLVSADIFRPGVANLTELRALAPNDVWDKTLIHVQDANTIYSYDLESTDVDDGLNVITPATNTGRWLKIGFAGAGTASSADKWVDVTKITENEVVVVDKTAESDWPQEVRREEIDVTETGAVLQVDDGYVISGPYNLAETLYTYNETQGTDLVVTGGDYVYLHESAPPTTAATQGSFFIGDGTSSTQTGQPYFRGPSNGPVSQLNKSYVEIASFAHDSASPIVLTGMKTGDVVVQIVVEVSATFGAGATISVGSSSAPTDMVGTSDVDLTTATKDTFAVMSSGASTDDVVITITPAGSTTGAGRVAAIIYRS